MTTEEIENGLPTHDTESIVNVEEFTPGEWLGYFIAVTLAALVVKVFPNS